VWSALPREEQPRHETAPIYELVARDGPKWGPGITGDVVVRLRDQSGQASLLRAAKTPIRRSDQNPSEKSAGHEVGRDETLIGHGVRGRHGLQDDSHGGPQIAVRPRRSVFRVFRVFRGLSD
jgi:hypothetical protein